MRTFALVVAGAAAYNNGNYAKKPPLGWQSWCAVGKCGTDHCYDRQIRQTADAMVRNGMKDLGYEWVVLDDCWHPNRTASGDLVPFADFFPDGMKPVVDYVHARGLKFGLYTSVGDRTCHGGWSPGSYGFYERDAAQFAAWGVDWVKVDWCGDDKAIEGHINMSRALNATGREMVLELCRGKYMGQERWGYAPAVAQVWRVTKDHHDDFASTRAQIDHLAAHGDWSGPFGWAYGDMMMTGGQGCEPYDVDSPTHCPEQTDAEYRTEFSAYAVLSSPMMIGTDVRNMTPIMEELMLNENALSINQDSAAPPGAIRKWTRGGFGYVRALSDGRVAIAQPNFDDAASRVFHVDLDALCAATPCVAALEDVWTRRALGTFASTYATPPVAPHDTLLVLATFQ